MTIRSILWTRLDRAGHDACRLRRDGAGWVIDGTALSRDDAGAACLCYSVTLDADWQTRQATVTGWVGADERRCELAAEAGTWHVDGTPRPDLQGALDVDLGFTPATNTCAIRRHDLAPGQSAASVAAWLDDASWTVRPLRQSYARRDARRYDYASPDHGFSARIDVDDAGLVRDYPGFWRAVA